MKLELSALSRLRENPVPAARLELGKCHARSNLLVAKAAKIVAEYELRGISATAGRSVSPIHERTCNLLTGLRGQTKL